MIAKTIAGIKKKIWELRGKKVGSGSCQEFKTNLLHPLGVQWGFPYIFSNTPGCASSSSALACVDKDLWGDEIRISFSDGRAASQNINVVVGAIGGRPEHNQTLLEGPPNQLVLEWGF